MNVQKRQSSQQCHLGLLGPTSVKAARKTLVKLTPGVNFINVLRASVMLTDPKSVKKTDGMTVLFCEIGICS